MLTDYVRSTMDFETGFSKVAETLPEMTNLLIDWSQTNSGSDNLIGVKKMQDKIKASFALLNATVTEHVGKPYRIITKQGQLAEQAVASVLHFQKRPQAPFQIFLGGHCDTVFSATHAFQNTIRLSPDKLQGPGVADMKGGLIVILYALIALEQMKEREKIGWQVVINADEELGSLGSSEIMAKLAKSCQAAFLYEPALDAAGTLAGQRSGTGNFSILLHGQAAHVGRAFHEGRSAIVALASLIEQLHALNRYPGLTVNVGYTQGGGALNVVPDFALCQVNVRTTAEKDEAVFEEQLQSIIQQISKQFACQLEYHGCFNRKPKIITSAQQKLYDYVIKQAQTLGLQYSVKATGGCCDGNNLAALGIPNVDTLGVCGGGIHSSDEFIFLGSLIERTQLSLALFQGIARGLLQEV